MSTRNGASLPDIDENDEEVTRPETALEAPAWMGPLIKEFRQRETVLLKAQESAGAIHGALNDVRVKLGDMDGRLTKLEKRVAVLLVLTEVLRTLVPPNVWSLMASAVGLS